MKRLYYCLSLLISILCVTSMSATDTISVKQTQIPILIEREDNVLFYLRMDAANSEMLNEVKLRFADDVNMDEIQSVKLYYSGTEAVQ